MSINVEEEFPFVCENESITEKDWAAGSREPKEFVECLITDKSAQYAKITYSPQMQKMFDEPIVNCLDHAVKTQGGANPVRHISITIDEDGRVIIWNDGDGIPAVVHPKASTHYKEETYVPTIVFARLFQGSNRNDDMPVGGTNGIGAKITNCLSTSFILDTVRDGKHFHQEWRGMTREGESKPDIKNVRVKPYTRLTFMPNYAHFGYNAEKLKEDMPNIIALLHSRVAMAAMFCKHAVSNIAIKFNDKPVALTAAQLATRLYPDSAQFRFTTDAPNGWPQRLAQKKFPWEITIVLAPHKHHHLVNINGIVVRDGRHITKLLKQVSAGVKEKVIKELKNDGYKLPANFVKNNCMLIINGQMIRPEWTGQRKDILESGMDKLTHLVIPDKILNSIVKTLSEMALMSGTEREVAKATKTAKEAYDKYVKAKTYGRKTALIACEGDSAMNQVKNGLSAGLGFDHYGIISLGGVIVNTMKETTEFENEETTLIRKTGKFEKNKFMTAFIQKVGLKYEYAYDPESATYKKEMDSLRYGAGIIIAVDQDMDGRGNIMPLLMALFRVFWPKLLKHGFLRWFCSDVVKMFPKAGGKVLSFWSEYEFHKVCRTVDTKKYNIKFYKGLGTNTPDETKAMFRNFAERLKTITTDDQTDELFEIYYGKFSALRKKKLSSPLIPISEEIIAKQEETKIVSASVHLESETRAFQMNNLEQKLDHMVDGQNQSSRKILNGALVYFAKNNNKTVRVAQLGGAISESQIYHHGEKSMFDSIKRRAFTGVGGVQLPFFKPVGQFGTRLEGGSDAASERYVETCLTDICRVVFNDLDYELLEFNMENNIRIEPKFFVPIVPPVLLESKKLPSHGWKIALWARDVFGVINAIRRLIAGRKAPELLPTRYDGAAKWNGRFGNIRGKPYSFGNYERYVLPSGKHLIRITELPLRVWTDVYMRNTLNKLYLKHDFIESAESNNNTEKVGIDIILSADGLDKIVGCGDGIWTDDIEEFFQLRSSMKSHINLIGLNGEVLEYNTYESVLADWFPVRKQMYARRIERQLALLDIQIKIRSEVLRYLDANYELRGMKRAAMDDFLAENDYVRCDTEYQRKIAFMPTNELKQIVFESDSVSYTYLLKISDMEKSAESISKKKEKLDKLIAERQFLLDDMATDAFVGASAWLRELAELERLIHEGYRTDWFFEDKDKYTY